MNPRLNTIDIVVSDMERAMAFYARLGLDFKLDPNTPEHAGCDLPGGLHLWHVDLYRLGSPEEAEELGLHDALQGGAALLIEWPERIEGLLPADRLDVALELPPAGGEGRVAHLTGGPSWADRLAGLAAGG